MLYFQSEVGRLTEEVSSLKIKATELELENLHGEREANRGKRLGLALCELESSGETMKEGNLSRSHNPSANPNHNPPTLNPRPNPQTLKPLNPQPSTLNPNPISATNPAPEWRSVSLDEFECLEKGVEDGGALDTPRQSIGARVGFRVM